MSEKRSPFVNIAVVLIVIVGSYLVWYTFLQPDPSGEIGIEMGNKLLDQDIDGINGGSIKFSDYEGSILILDFMAPWCEPCKDQVPILAQIESIPGVEVLTINIDPNYNTTSLQGFGEEEGITWFFGHSPFTALDFEVSGVPTVIIVDREGIIQYRGFFTTMNVFERVLSPMLG
jgi:thiol-disulfide isomerase/thioredoxin